MRSSWARLAILVIIALKATLSQAARLISTDIPALANDTGQGGIWTDPIPGVRALAGFYQHHLTVGKRDCLSNGSNYCFGNDIDYCAGCGNCCVDTKHCCGSGRICCGTGCCASDETCSGGRCVSSV